MPPWIICKAKTTILLLGQGMYYGVKSQGQEGQLDSGLGPGWHKLDAL